MFQLQVFHILNPTFFPQIQLGVFAERLIDWKMAQSLENIIICIMETPQRFAMSVSREDKAVFETFLP